MHELFRAKTAGLPRLLCKRIIRDGNCLRWTNSLDETAKRPDNRCTLKQNFASAASIHVGVREHVSCTGVFKSAEKKQILFEKGTDPCFSTLNSIFTRRTLFYFLCSISFSKLKSFWVRFIVVRLFSRDLDTVLSLIEALLRNNSKIPIAVYLESRNCFVLNLKQQHLQYFSTLTNIFSPLSKGFANIHITFHAISAAIIKMPCEDECRSLINIDEM